MGTAQAGKSQGQGCWPGQVRGPLSSHCPVNLVATQMDSWVFCLHPAQQVSTRVSPRVRNCISGCFSVIRTSRKWDLMFYKVHSQLFHLALKTPKPKPLNPNRSDHDCCLNWSASALRIFLPSSQPGADGGDEQLGNDPLSCRVINALLFF